MMRYCRCFSQIAFLCTVEKYLNIFLLLCFLSFWFVNQKYIPFVKGCVCFFFFNMLQYLSTEETSLTTFFTAVKNQQFIDIKPTPVDLYSVIGSKWNLAGSPKKTQQCCKTPPRYAQQQQHISVLRGKIQNTLRFYDIHLLKSTAMCQSWCMDFFVFHS